MMHLFGRLSVLDALLLIIALWFVCVGLACGGFAAFVAMTKGRSARSWFALGLFFGPLALVAIAGAEASPTAAK